MKYQDGDVVWKIPIRYWEDQKPTRCVVAGDQQHEVHPAGQFNSSALYVHADEFGHCVYVNPDDCFFSEATAHDVAVLRKLIMNLRRKDEMDKVFERMDLFKDKETPA